MDVGVRELKQQLSELLDRAERGEIIRITDRGRPKALLMPIPRANGIARGIAEGWIRPAAPGPKPPAPPRVRADIPSSIAFDEDRGE